MPLMILPLLIGGVCIITSIIGTYMVRLGAKGSIMGALYKGFWTATLLAVPAICGVFWYALGGDLSADRSTTSSGAQLPRHEPRLVELHRPGRHRADRVDHRILYRHQLPPGAVDRPRLARPATAPTSSRASPSALNSTALPTHRHRRRPDRELPARGLPRRRLRGFGDARARRHGRRARRLRPGHRQCRRNRRNGGPRG